MPQALEIDHEQVKLVALQIGVREAARQYGISEDTVRQWSCREEWFDKRTEEQRIVQVARERKMESQGLSPNVTKTAVDVLKDYSGRTKLSLARGISQTCETIEEGFPLELATQVKSLAGAAAIVHNWSSSGPGTSVRLDLLAGTLQVDQQTPSNDLDIPE